MASSDGDEELRQAIALSLQDQKLGSSSQTVENVGCPTEVIDLDSEDDSTHAQKTFKENSTSQASLPQAVCKGFLLDRKVMEQERLARKRKASISPPPLRKTVKLSRDRSPPSIASISNNDGSAKSLDPPRSKSTASLIKSSVPTSASEPTFLDGAVRKTWASGYDRNEDIKIEEVLQRNDLTLAVLSSFQWEIDWLFSKLNLKTTQVTLVMQAKDEPVKRQYEEETSAMPNIRLCFPPMEGSVQCMHSKLMLLGHPSYLRIVVPTANLVPYDWGEGGIMENMLFLIDLPRLPASHAKTPMTSFGKELIYFLEATGLDGKSIQSISNFDFSRTQDIAFVHSIGGVHVGKEESWRRTGYCGLGTAIRELGLANESTLTVDFVTSSMGSLNIEFLTTLYMAAQGDDGLTEYGWRNATSKSNKTKASKEQQEQRRAMELIQQKTRDHFQVYFPTHETVAASNGGTACGGTICCQWKFYTYPQFPRGVLRDCESRRTGLLMHNKVEIPIFLPNMPTQPFSIPFLYNSLTSSPPTKAHLRPPNRRSREYLTLTLIRMGIRRIRQLQRKRLGQNDQRPQPQNPQTHLPKLGMRRRDPRQKSKHKHKHPLYLY